ncbi:uncharacterized protein LOC115231583 [Octopus sinensis]|uniref:Uncharacterized protein LOC115231583 n=1 Tax=Octopus sinensis TaxID=2607531 RepID=A0A6P7U7S0_9MOLL|nr:uncharacterized protein LOC115231583 [Octopus sinensis]
MMAFLSPFDRTSEFKLTANSMKSKNSPPIRQNTIPQERIEFINISQELARNLSFLNMRIEKLSELVSSSSLFNSRANEIENQFSNVAKELQLACTHYDMFKTVFLNIYLTRNIQNV